MKKIYEVRQYSRLWQSHQQGKCGSLEDWCIFHLGFCSKYFHPTHKTCPLLLLTDLQATSRHLVPLAYWLSKDVLFLIFIFIHMISFTSKRLKLKETARPFGSIFQHWLCTESTQSKVKGYRGTKHLIIVTNYTTINFIENNRKQ